MSGIVGSKFNHRGSGITANQGTDGQIITSQGQGVKQAFETAATTDLTPVRQDVAILALREQVNNNANAYNLPNSFIDHFEDDSGILTETNGDRSTDEYWSTIAPAGYAFADDANTMILMHSNTTNGSTTFTDSSSIGSTTHTLTGQTSAQHVTAQYKFGSSSIYQNGTSGGVYAADHADLRFGSGAFTLECWFKSSATSGDPGIWFKTASQTSCYMNLNNNGTLRCFEEIGNTMYWIVNGTGSAYNDGNWHHVALSRGSGEASRLSLDGILVGTGSGNRNWDNAGNMNMGAMGTGYSGELWLDEFRISDSERYPTNPFTPPTEATTVSATGTLFGIANVPNDARTKVSGVILYKDNAGTATIGTDLKIYFSCNGGSNWTEAASYTAITPVFSSGIKIVSLGETTCTSGSDVRYKAVWANQAASSKETRLHGIGLNY